MTVPPPSARGRRWPLRAAVAYLALALGLWAALHLGADEAALPTLFLFGPRWVVAVPLLLLLPLSLYARSRWAIGLTLLTALVAAGPLTGGVSGVGNLLKSERPALTNLRVVTWNMGGVKPGPTFQRFLAEVNPDVVVLQEAPNELAAGHFPPGWSFVPGGGRPLASRYRATLKGELTAAQLGAEGVVAWYTLATTDGEIQVVNVHLPTPRPGIEAAMDSRFSNLAELHNVIGARAAASRTARIWIGSVPPNMIVAGDFNMPVESRIYREYWGSLGDAFSDAGVGWGTTKQTSWFGTRIDHVLYPDAWRCRKVWVGPAMGSDHCPVIADLAKVDD